MSKRKRGVRVKSISNPLHNPSESSPSEIWNHQQANIHTPANQKLKGIHVPEETSSLSKNLPRRQRSKWGLQTSVTDQERINTELASWSQFRPRSRPLTQKSKLLLAMSWSIKEEQQSKGVRLIEILSLLISFYCFILFLLNIVIQLCLIGVREGAYGNGIQKIGEMHLHTLTAYGSPCTRNALTKLRFVVDLFKAEQRPETKDQIRKNPLMIPKMTEDWFTLERMECFFQELQPTAGSTFDSDECVSTDGEWPARL
ncbi:hypothetical protein HAX54_033782 [Datura stramonium]|uniref:Uncharacterized protein n=1 Tax=Datura stramonium TaxID=4076 RepID=A0ABS8VFJ2_DATST|nr:hypothetical protein [Datura stramonium]